MKRKTLVAGIAIAGLALGTAACSSPNSSSEVTELSIWTGFTGGDAAGYDTIVSAFNASHPGIHVTMTVQPWDTIQQKLPSAWLTGQGPDIAAPSSDPNVIAQYVKTKSLLALTNTGDGDDKINVNALAPVTVDEFTYDQKLYAVPANLATLSLYYNKKAFTAAGITTPPTTVAELKADAKKLTLDGGSTQYGLALADNQTIQMWPVLQWLDGGDIVDQATGCSVVDSAANKKSLTEWAGLVTNDKISPVGLTGAEADSLFSAGKAAMEINGPWAASGFKAAGIDLGIATVPVGVNGPVTLGSTVALAVSAKTKHPAEAQEFLAYWTSKNVQKAFSLQTGFPPMRTDLADDPELAADPTVSIFTSQVPNARLYLPQVPEATKVDSEAYVPMIGQITRGTSIDTSTSEAKATINKLTGCAS